MSRRDVENVRKLVAASATLDRYGQREMRRVANEAVKAAAAITQASIAEGSAAQAGRSDSGVRYAVSKYDAAFTAAEKVTPDGFFPKGSRELILMAASEAPRALAGIGIGVSAGDGGGRQRSRGGSLEL